MKFSFEVMIALVAAVATATPAVTPADSFVPANGDSGCSLFSDPDCGVNGSYCSCMNGCFYYTNDGGCQPPGGYITCMEPGLPGYNC